MDDRVERMNYESYVQPHAAAPVIPSTAGPDEKFFIRTHQAFEIWFAQCIEELEYARNLLQSEGVQEEDIPPITQHVRRATGIFNLLTQHFPLLETLETRSFFDFRRSLFGASGQQSYRFREVEWILGLDPNSDDLVRYLGEKDAINTELQFPGSDAELKAAKDYKAFCTQSLLRQAEGTETMTGLKRRLEDVKVNGSFRSNLLKWLARTPYPGPSERIKPEPHFTSAFVEGFREAFKAAYRDDWRVLIERGLKPNQDVEVEVDKALRRVNWFLEAPERRAVLFILQFADWPLLAWPAALLEAVLELDQALINWRTRHIAMVSRVLGGGRLSTTGSAGSGLPYLRQTQPLKAFPELWDARSFLLGHDEVRGIYAPGLLERYGFRNRERVTE